MNRSRLLIAVMALFLCAFLAQGKESWQFTRMSTTNSDLSYDVVRKIISDSRGYVWIGTAKGLNCYDGNSFKVWYKEDLGLESDFITSLAEDAGGNIWIGTQKGAAMYDFEMDTFVPLDGLTADGSAVTDQVNNIVCEPSGKVWMTVNNQGCFSIMSDVTDFRNYYFDRNGVKVPTTFRRYAISEKGDFWIARYHDNLYLSDTTLTSLNPVRFRPDPDYFKGDEIEALIFSKEDPSQLYVASVRNGLSVVDTESLLVRHLYSLPKGVLLTDASLQEERWFWLSTTRGLYRYDMLEDSFVCLSHSDDRFSIASNYVFTSHIDRYGGLWVGTKDGGVSWSGNGQRYFEKIYADGVLSLESALVSGFAYDDKETLYVTSEQSGVFSYNLTTGRIKPLRGLPQPMTFCFPCYDDGYLWLGSLNGLWRYDTRTGAVRNYGILRGPSGINDPRVYTVYKSSNGNLYAGTTLGMFRYNLKNDTFEPVLSMTGVFVTGFADDSYGNLWVSSFKDGLYCLNNTTGEILGRYTSSSSALASDKICSVMVDSKSNVWVVGFSSGFAMLDKKSGTFSTYDMKSLPGLPTDVYFRAVEDCYGNIWLSSDNGLVEYNPRTSGIRVFTETDGILDDKFCNAAAVTSTGEIFMGSDNGFIRFSPSGISAVNVCNAVAITAMRIGDELVKPGVEGSPLDMNIDICKEVSLEPDQNSFGFSFAMLGDFSSTECRAQCMLEGHDQDWKDISAKKSVFWYNVPAGSYRLKVRSSGAEGPWKEAHMPVTIVVEPEFFSSLPGILLILFLIAIAVIVVIRLIYRRSEKRKDAENLEFRKAKEQELFYEKMNFFSHVVHEIKTPLTLIRTPLQAVIDKKKGDESISHDLKLIYNSTEYLAQLVNELLEFVRIEKKGVTLDCSPVELVQKLEYLIFNYSDTASNKNIRIGFEKALSQIWVSADESALNKILNNLLFNAVKYADTYIDIKVSEEKGVVRCEFRNDGSVIDPSQREAVFQPFVQMTSSEKGFGIGLSLARSLARMHSGDLVIADEQQTCFVLTLPLIEAPVVETRGQEIPTEVNGEYGNDESKSVIMVVDDNSDMREFLQSKLEGSYEVIPVRNGKLAIELLSETNVDLVISDISMPEMNGLDLCRSIRDNIEISHLPIIILSARSSVESKIEAMKAGADLYIEKPFVLEYLQTSVYNIMERRQLMKKAMNIGISNVDIDMFGLPKRDEEFLMKFDQIIMNNITNADLSNDLLASQLCISESTLIRKIRKLLNTSTSNYIRVKRLNIAAQMLKDAGGSNVTDICYTVGFSNLSYFSKCFKEHFGCTPSEYISGMPQK